MPTAPTFGRLHSLWPLAKMAIPVVACCACVCLSLSRIPSLHRVRLYYTAAPIEAATGHVLQEPENYEKQ